MLTDAHCHPFDLHRVFLQAENDRRRLGVVAAASSCDLEEFAHNESLAGKAASDSVCAILPCFAVHPQLPAAKTENSVNITQNELEKKINALQNLAAAGRLAAIGECGFDLYNAEFKETEAVQDRLFEEHLKTALCYNLPVIIHARRAMHKIFASSKSLAKCKAVVFHSWSGTLEEGKYLLRKGVNAYFSFGNVILNGHKRAMRSCAFFPAQRLLTETDAPYQPQKGKSFSCWADIPVIIETTAALRREAQSEVTDAKELETMIEKNFFDVFTLTR